MVKISPDGAAPAMFHKSIRARVKINLAAMRKADAAIQMMRGVMKEFETAEQRLGNNTRGQAGRLIQGGAQAGGGGRGDQRRDNTAENKSGFGRSCQWRGEKGDKALIYHRAPSHHSGGIASRSTGGGHGGGVLGGGGRQGGGSVSGGGNNGPGGGRGHGGASSSSGTCGAGGQHPTMTVGPGTHRSP